MPKFYLASRQSNFSSKPSKYGVFIASLILFVSLSPYAFSQENESAVLNGRVIDQQGKPVAKAKVIIHDQESQEESSGQSDGDGVFKVKHASCNSLSFEVLPPKKSGLTRAHFTQVNGESNKHFIVQLHQGFSVTGKITYRGVGLKGLEIKVFGHENAQDSNETVHGGGHTESKNNGEFTILLTPGKKTFEIKNDVYSDVPAIFHHDATITGDCRLADIEIPVPKRSKKHTTTGEHQ